LVRVAGHGPGKTAKPAAKPAAKALKELSPGAVRLDLEPERLEKTIL